MKKFSATYDVANHSIIKQQILHWCNQFNICCFFDNNNYASPYNSYECLAAVATIPANAIIENISIEQLHQQVAAKKDWLFGHISYDFKNQIFSSLSTQHSSAINFPNCFLFEPHIVICYTKNTVTIESNFDDCNFIYQNIINISITTITPQQKIIITPKISKLNYIAAVEAIQQHIQIGDCYELNFCQEFYAQNAVVNPLHTFIKLNQISPTPFAAFYKLHDKYLLCASPERFIKKEEKEIISQPIKGTIKRDLNNSINDELLKQQLQQSPKEQSENVMIVDLVRNDLSKIAHKNSVVVKELMQIYSFKQVHQMISTVAAQIDTDINFVKVLQALFPMGSMTGAPKYKVMQLIEQYEKTARNIYSGSVGYITPQNNFDFNVVIRSIMYNAAQKHISYQVGSAITYYSNAMHEYEECLLKAKAMQDALC